MISHIQNVVTLTERLEEGLSEYIDDTLAADVDSALVLLFLVQLKDKYQMSAAETKELAIKMLDCWTNVVAYSEVRSGTAGSC